MSLTYEVSDDDDELRLSIVVLDLTESDLKIAVDNNSIIVSGAREVFEGKEMKFKTKWRKALLRNPQTIELSHVEANLSDNFKTSWRVSFLMNPRKIELSLVRANLSGSVLMITAPKNKDARTSTIQVRSDPSTIQEAEEAIDSIDMHVLHLDVPGIKIIDLRVTLKNENMIKVEGVRHIHSVTEEDRKDVRYSKSCRIDPKDLKVSLIRAALSDGVLTVFAPKREKQQPIIIVVSNEPHDRMADSSKEMVRIALELPGVKPCNLSVRFLDENIIDVKGSRRVPFWSPKKTSFAKTFRFNPESVDVPKLKASLCNGVLVISAPTKQVAEQTEQIIPITTRPSPVVSHKSMNKKGEESPKDKNIKSSFGKKRSSQKQVNNR